MARTFNGSTAFVTLSNVGANNIGYGTWAAVIRRSVNNVYGGVLSHVSSANANVGDFYITSANTIGFSNATASRGGATTILAANGYHFVAVTKGTGSVTARAHVYKYGLGTWAHEAMTTGSIGDVGSIAGGTLNIGRTGGATPGDYFNGDIAWVGFWGGKAMTDAQVEMLAYDWGALFQLNPTGLWPLWQSLTTTPVADIVGVAHQSALTGTTIATAGVPIFSWGGGGAHVGGMVTGTAHSINPANETDVAQPKAFTKTIRLTLGTATTTSVAQPVSHGTSPTFNFSPIGGPILGGAITAIYPPGGVQLTTVGGLAPNLLFSYITQETFPFVLPDVRVPPPVVWLLDENRNTLAELEAYDSCVWTRRFYQIGQFELQISRLVSGASLIAPGRFIRIDDDPEFGPPLVYMIERAEFVMDEAGSPSDVIGASGYDYGMFRERHCLPPPFTLPPTQVYHEVQGAAETFMKQLVSLNAGPNAQAERRVPNLVLEADLARGPIATWQARYQKLHDRLEQVARASEVGWEVVYRLSDDQFVFMFNPGVDLTQDVVVDVEFDSAQAQRWTRDLTTSKTFLYVGGQGIGDGRPVSAAYEGDNSPSPTEPAGLARREEFIDAADVADPNQLNQRGHEELADRTVEESLDATVAQFGPFLFLRHYRIGDLVLIRNVEWGIARPARIVEVRRSHRPEPGLTTTEVSFDKEKPKAAAAIEKLVKKAAASLA